MMSSRSKPISQAKFQQVLINGRQSSAVEDARIEKEFNHEVATGRQFYLMLSLLTLCIALFCFWRGYNVEHNWPQVNAEVDSFSVKEETNRKSVRYLRTVFYHYRFKDVVYLGDDSISESVVCTKMKANIAVFCNPAHPSDSRIFLDRDAAWSWFWAIAALIIGFCGVPSVKTEVARSSKFARTAYAQAHLFRNDSAALAREIIKTRHPIASEDRRIA